MQTYYYPKNLRAQAKVLLWPFRTFVFLIFAAVIALLIFSNTSNTFLLYLALTAGVCTAEISDGISIGSLLKTSVSYIGKPQFFKNAAVKNSTQQLIGGMQTGEDIYVTNHGRFVIWQVQPFNLAVLSPKRTEQLIMAVTQLISQNPGLEIIATDAARDFDANIGYLKQRITEEDNPAIKNLLIADLESISALSSRLTSTRRYLFLLSLSHAPGVQDAQMIRRYGKAIQDAGFHTHQLSSSEIRHVIANYFDITNTPPETDGEQFI